MEAFVEMVKDKLEDGDTGERPLTLDGSFASR
jgi:hypothetical protein